jgi:tetratricopeptide (TPR) repeat protein
MAQNNATNEKLATVIRWGIFLCAFIPLVIFREFISPFHFGKIILFRPLIELTGVLYLILILRDRSYLPKTNFIFWAITAFVGAYGLSTLTSVYSYQSMWGTLERMGGFFSMLHFWLFFVIMISVLREEKHWRLFLKISVMGAFVSIVYAINQKYPFFGIQGTDGAHAPIVNYIVGYGITRVFGTLGNTALFAGYILLNIFFSVILLLRKSVEETKLRTYIIIASIALLFAIIFRIYATSGAQIAGPDSLIYPNIAWENEAFLFLVVGLGFLLYLIRPIEKYFLGAFTLLGVVIVFMTAVRGSIMAILASVAVFALLVISSGYSRKLGRWLIALAIVLFILEGSIIAGKNTNFVRSHSILLRLSDVSLQSKTVETRFWAWRAGIDGWNDSAKTIILGWGPEDFDVPFSKHFDPRFFEGSGSETLFDRAHNMFVEVLVTMGVIGIIAYLAVFVALFWAMRKLWLSVRGTGSSVILRLTASAVIAGLVAYMIHNSFIFDTSANLVAFFTLAGFIYYIDTIGLAGSFQNGSRRSIPKILANVIILVAVCVACYSIYETSIIPAEANYAYTRGIHAQWNGDIVGAVNKFKESLSYGTFGSYDYRHKYQQFLLENVSKLQKEPTYSDPNAKETVVDLLLQGANELKKNLAFKDDYLPYLYLSRTYIVLGSGDKASPYNDLALEEVNKALAISPTFIRSYYELAQVYINKGDLNNAINTFLHANQLNGNVSQTWWYLGITYLDKGDLEHGIQAVNKAKELGFDFTDPGHGADGIRLFERLVKLQPNNATYAAGLAQSYASTGRLDDAVTFAKKAAQLDPRFEEDARAFVQSLGKTW